jgi:hypothetical protein
MNKVVIRKFEHTLVKLLEILKNHQPITGGPKLTKQMLVAITGIYKLITKDKPRNIWRTT